MSNQINELTEEVKDLKQRFFNLVDTLNDGRRPSKAKPQADGCRCSRDGIDYFASYQQLKQMCDKLKEENEELKKQVERWVFWVEVMEGEQCGLNLQSKYGDGGSCIEDGEAGNGAPYNAMPGDADIEFMDDKVRVPMKDGTHHEIPVINGIMMNSLSGGIDIDLRALADACERDDKKN